MSPQSVKTTFQTENWRKKLVLLLMFRHRLMGSAPEK